MLKYTSLLLGLCLAHSSVKAMDLVAPDLEPHQARALFRKAPCEVDIDNGHAERMGHLDILQPLLGVLTLDVIKSYVTKPPVLKWFVESRMGHPDLIKEIDVVVCEGFFLGGLRYSLQIQKDKFIVGCLDFTPRGVTEGIPNPFSNSDNVRSLLDQNDKEATFDGRLWIVVRNVQFPRDAVAGNEILDPTVEIVHTQKGPKYVVEARGPTTFVMRACCRFHNKRNQTLGFISLFHRQPVFPEAVSPPK